MQSIQQAFKATRWQLNHCPVKVNFVREPPQTLVLSFFSPQFPFPHLGCHCTPPFFTPRPRWHLPGAPMFSQGSPCCSARVETRGFMVHIHQHHMTGFMGDGVQTWLLWISLAEADLWAVVGYNGWASFYPTPTSIHLLYVSFGPSCPQP